MVKSKKLGYLTARVYNAKSSSILVRVPVLMTVIPEVPEVIMMDGWVATLLGTNPLTYETKVYARAKKI